MSVGYTWVQWNRHKVVYDVVVLTGIVLYVVAFLSAGKLAWRGDHAISDEILLIRALGTLAIILLHVILLIGPLARLDRRFLPLLYNRRHLGVATFVVALLHGTAAIGFYHGFGTVNPLVSILSSNTEFDSVTEFPFELLGMAALVVMFFMASTSHDFWNRNLGPAAWKTLHMLVYVAYGLLVAHVTLGALQKERSVVYAVLLGAGVVMLTGLHLLTGFSEARRDRRGRSAAGGWIDVGPVSEIPEKRAAVVGLDGGERVAVFRYEGKLSAVTNVCRHQGGPLGEGKVIDGCITCPWHGWQYRPGDGRSPPPFTERVETFELRLDGDRVLLDPSPKAPGTPVTPVEIPSEAVRRAGARDDDDLYVAYRPVASAQRRFVRLVAPVALVMLMAAGAIIAWFQADPGTGRWPFGRETLVEGIVLDTPYAMLVRPDVDPPETILLVGNGKYGAIDQVRDAAGTRVRLSGVPISRHGMRLLELWPSAGTVTPLEETASVPPAVSLGRRTLRGEIIDPKCYFGAMKPAEGKTHKACAILCIRGGIPPMLATRDERGSPTYYLLVGPDGGPANELVIPHVGEPVEVTGDVEERAGLRSLRVTGDSFRPVQ